MTNKTNKKEVSIRTREEATAKIQKTMNEISAEAEKLCLRSQLMT